MVSEKKKKYPQKTVLPVNNTTNQFKEQLNDHESRRIRLNEEIQEITSQLRLNYNLVGKKAKNMVLQVKYLKHEVIFFFDFVEIISRKNYLIKLFSTDLTQSDD